MLAGSCLLSYGTAMGMERGAWDAATAAAWVRRRAPHTGPRANSAWLLVSGRVEVLLWDWPAEVDGMLAIRQGRAHIGLNRSHPYGRRHFTFWHEIGHWLLHAGAGCGADEAREAEANAFAAQVLMPREWVLRLRGEGLDARSLARAFGVTLAALERRLWELRLRPQSRSGRPSRMLAHGMERRHRG